MGQQERNGNGGRNEGGKHDSRARSYKGVVLHGDGGNQNREREGRDYYGKEKGKMGEEAGSKWVKTADRGTKKHVEPRENFGGGGGSARNRNSAREGPRDTV